MKRWLAVLFDYDGVIARSMEDNYKAWRHALKKHGVRINKNDYFLIEGSGTDEVAGYFLQKGGKEIRGIKNIVVDKENYFIKNNKFTIYPGVKEIIALLKDKGYLIGLVTGGNWTRVFMTAGKHFLDNFDIVVTGDKVNKTKPYPDPYLAAAEGLNLKPEQCLAVENAPLGIRSAKAAGMYCLAISSTLDKKYLVDADKVFSKINSLRHFLLKKTIDR